MWGGYGFGIVRQVYNRKPKGAFAELKAKTATEPALRGPYSNNHEVPESSVINKKTGLLKLWHYLQLLFSLMAVVLFVVMFLAVLYKFKG